MDTDLLAANLSHEDYRVHSPLHPIWSLVSSLMLLCGFAKFEGQSIFDGEEWVLDGFILGRNWQWCQLKVFPQGNVDFPIDSRRVVLSLLRGKCCWSSLRLVEDYGSNWWYQA